MFRMHMFRTSSKKRLKTGFIWMNEGIIYEQDISYPLSTKIMITSGIILVLISVRQIPDKSGLHDDLTLNN